MRNFSFTFASINILNSIYPSARPNWCEIVSILHHFRLKLYRLSILYKFIYGNDITFSQFYWYTNISLNLCISLFYTHTSIVCSYLFSCQPISLFIYLPISLSLSLSTYLSPAHTAPLLAGMQRCVESLENHWNLLIWMKAYICPMTRRYCATKNKAPSWAEAHLSRVFIHRISFLNSSRYWPRMDSRVGWTRIFLCKHKPSPRCSKFV